MPAAWACILPYPAAYYCRLTWLGDAVLGATVSDLLYIGLPPNATTEQLHNRRMVCWGIGSRSVPSGWRQCSPYGLPCIGSCWQAAIAFLSLIVTVSMQELVRQEACAAGAARLGLPELLVVGKGYEGQAPTPRMLAGELMLE